MVDEIPQILKPGVWALLLLGLGGCGSGELGRHAGVYPTGSFAIESGNPFYRSNGMLALYVNETKFRMEMRLPNQEFDVTGTWRAQADRILLAADRFEFKNPTEDDQRTLAHPIISPDAVRAAFGHELVFEASSDRRRLTGLKTSLGPLLGRFEFSRPIPH